MWKDEGTAGMDNYCNWKIYQTTGTEGKQIFTDEPLACDIKSDVNIWKWNPNAGTSYPIEDFIEGLSDDEINMLYGISNRYSSKISAR